MPVLQLVPTKSEARIPFNRVSTAGRELAYIAEAIANSHLSGDGSFTSRCHAAIEQMTQCRKALLTHSCTAALEMAAILIDLKPGDEVIMPSFTFVSTANAVVLRGAVPVFIDIRADTLNMDEKLVEAAITPKTKAIFVVHYAGVGCDMDPIMEVAERHGLMVVEDAAQGILASYKGRPLGSIGHLACLSFHETKNIVSGEGGALLINDASLIDRAHIIREKGTNRTAFFQGQVDKYTWVDIGSSYLPSEIIAAFLLGQLEQAARLRNERVEAWEIYRAGLAPLEASGLIRLASIPAECETNGHIFFVIMPTSKMRIKLLEACKAADIGATFHYIPLHSAPAGRRHARAHGSMAVTDDLSARMARLPLWPGIGKEEVLRVVDMVARVVTGH